MSNLRLSRLNSHDADNLLCKVCRLEKLAENMAWVEDFSPGTLRLIGILEILGAIGVILPVLTRILPWLTPLAAVGLVLTMMGAILTHARRGEYSHIMTNVILLALATFVAYGRFVAIPV